MREPGTYPSTSPTNVSTGEVYKGTSELLATSQCLGNGRTQDPWSPVSCSLFTLEE